MGFKKMMRKAGHAVVNTANSTGNAIVNTATDAGQEVVNIANDATNETAKIANQVAKEINKQVLGPVGKAVVDNAALVAKQANIASDEFMAGATIVGGELEKSAYVVRDGAILVEKWVEANACNLGMSIALGVLFGAMLYRPDPVSQAQTTATMTPLSAVAIAYLAAKEAVQDTVVGEACGLTAAGFVELLWLSPDIRQGVGNSNKEILTYGIAYCISKSFEVAAGSFVVPQVGAAMVAGIVSSIVSQLVCDGKLPSGARAWAMTGADGL